MKSFDYVLVGGGLHNGLCALAITHAQPQARLALLESGSTLGGNHTWSFHQAGVQPASMAWLQPLIAHEWPRHHLHFPNLRRELDLPYLSITSERFDAVVRAALARSGSALLLNHTVAEVHAHEAVGADGSRVEGELVIDARGPQALGARDCGFQKFVGLEVETTEPHGVQAPVLMDARVEQLDGFRFMYVLPLSPTRCLVEDTRFSNDAALDRSAMRREVLRYLSSHSLQVKAVVREEQGVLPMSWSWTGPDEPPRASPLQAGYAAGWFHPATGYSLPCAVWLAQHLSSVPANQVFDARLDSLWGELRAQARFYHALNWLLFHAVEPQLRFDLFERFHRLPQDAIARFYAMRSAASDRVRMLAMGPPKGLSLRLMFSSLSAGRGRPLSPRGSHP
jgi:lycopene beta-cyclase